MDREHAITYTYLEVPINDTVTAADLGIEDGDYVMIYPELVLTVRDTLEL